MKPQKTEIFGTFSSQMPFFILEKWESATIIWGILGENGMSINPPKASSIAGPLILIAIGILFLAHNLIGFNVFHLVVQYWPLILIAVGVAKLVDYFRLSKQEGKTGTRAP
jgi:hypothetical protein